MVGTFGPLTGLVPTAEGVTRADGTYELPLGSGRYVIEGLKKAPGNVGTRPGTGDFYCLHSGSPVAVTEGAWTAVGLNLVRVVDAKGIAAPGLYVLAYPSEHRVGLPLATSARTDADGRVRLPLAPGQMPFFVRAGRWGALWSRGSSTRTARR